MRIWGPAVVRTREAHRILTNSATRNFKDFGDAPPLLRGEYADDDQDGLPNWFEMYWFGKFLDWNTASIADPGADPDSDGQTNRLEYPARSDPTKPPASVPAP